MISQLVPYDISYRLFRNVIDTLINIDIRSDIWTGISSKVWDQTNNSVWWAEAISETDEDFIRWMNNDS